MVVVRFREIPDLSFNKTFRVYISGSSESGKTFFAKQLLQRKLFDYSRIYYFHPDFHEENPTDWQETLDVPVIFSAEFPTSKDFLAMPENSVIVFDDLVDQCVTSKCVDYLYRVLSGKRNLHVILMSQRYFVHDRFALSIRNSSNYHVLMRNCDLSNVTQIARSLGLKQEIQAATNFNQEKEYPYIFIDRTNKARARNTEVYIDILSRYFILIRGSMKFFLLSEVDFNRSYNIIDSELAENANSPQAVQNSAANAAGSGTDSAGNVTTNKPTKSVWKKRVQRQQRLRRAIHKYQISSQL